MNTPKWAQDFILNAILYLEAIGHKAELPNIHWRNAQKVGYWRDKKRQHSSGTCYPGKRINIVAGQDRLDCKLVILHELAHWVTPGIPKYLDVEASKKRGWVYPNGEPSTPIISRVEFHTPSFWDVAWKLYREFKLPIRYCKEREGNYMKGALIAYRKATKH